MKLLITTRADENIKEMTDITHPLIKRYAEHCNADFMLLDSGSPCSEGNGKYHYRIMRHYQLFNDYDRILQIDSDIIINKNCPNLFEVVPHEYIGTVFEDKGTRIGVRVERIRKVQEWFGNVGWSEGYINTGVFLSSSIHKKIYLPIANTYWKESGFDDVHIGYNIHKYKFKVFELPFKWNHMTMFSEPWNHEANRFNSYMIHFAGQGIFDKKMKGRIKQMVHDYNVIFDK